MPDDYADRAAREWFAKTQDALTRHKAEYPQHNEVWTGNQLQLDREIARLADVIRKHVSRRTEARPQRDMLCGGPDMPGR